MKTSWYRAVTAIGVTGVLGLLASALPATSASAATSMPAPTSALLAALHDPAKAAGDYFGFSVAVAGTTAIVGAPQTKSFAGAAYIYSKGASGWPKQPNTTLSDPAATPDDEFGISVAMLGNYALVGAFGTSSSAGAAYIYVKGWSGWPTHPTTTLSDPAATTLDQFGVSVAMSKKTAVVGADNTSSGAGAAYIYKKAGSAFPTTPTATLSDPAATSDDYFGHSVAVLKNTVLVGAFGTSASAGAAYFYVKSPSGWPTTPTTTLSDPAATSDDYFGFSLAVSKTTAIVGASGTNSSAGTAYIYVKGGSVWPATPTTTMSDPASTAGDMFGNSVAVSGTTAVVGAPGPSSSGGTAYVYVKGSSAWPTSETKTFSPKKSVAGKEFGESVAVSGTTAVVGTPGPNSSHGAAYIEVA
jgi:hypothetical protein